MATRPPHHTGFIGGRGRPPHAHAHAHAHAPTGNPPSPTISAIPSDADALVYQQQIHALAAGRPDLLPLLVPRPPVLPLGPVPANLAAAAAVAGVPSPTAPHAIVAPPPTTATPSAAAAVASTTASGPGSSSAAPPAGPPPIPRSILDTPLTIPPPGCALPSMDNVQTHDIPTPYIHPNDVLCGRGGGTNNHAGNEKFRDLVNQQKVAYLHSSKRDKPFVSRGIVRAVRAQNPPGRFLQKDEKTGLWYDIGDQKAREKTSQALREGAPEIRREITSSWVANSPAARGPTIIPAAGFPAQPTNTGIKIPASAVPHVPHGAKSGAPGFNAQALAAVRAASGPPGSNLAYFSNAAATMAGIPAAGIHAPGLSAAGMSAATINGAPPGFVDHLGTVRIGDPSTATRAAANAPKPAKPADPPARIADPGASPTGEVDYLESDRGGGSAKLHTQSDASSSPFGPVGLGALRGHPQGILDPTRTHLMRLGRGVDLAGRPGLAAPFSSLGGPGGLVSTSPLMGRGRALPPYATTAPMPLQTQQQQPPPRQAVMIPIGRGHGTASKPIPRAPGAVVKPVADTASAAGPRRSKGSNGSSGRKKDSHHHQAPPLSHDTARRLVLAETVAQKTVNRTITEELKAAEQRVSLYLDAGLLGIPPKEMARHMVQGHTEQEIIDFYYKKLKGDRNCVMGETADNKRKLTTNDTGRATKRSKVSGASLAGVATLTDKSIQDALVSIGAA